MLYEHGTLTATYGVADCVALGIDLQLVDVLRHFCVEGRCSASFQSYLNTTASWELFGGAAGSRIPSADARPRFAPRPQRPTSACMMNQLCNTAL